MKKEKGFLYCIENKINNKKYIGLTYQTIKKRWKEHQTCANSPAHQHKPLYRSILKNGIENFEVYEIGQYERGELELKEQEYIQKYDTFAPNGYNLTLGGEGCRRIKFDDEIFLIRMYTFGLPIAMVASHAGRSASAVRSMLRRHNIHIRRGDGIIPMQDRTPGVPYDILLCQREEQRHADLELFMAIHDPEDAPPTPPKPINTVLEAMQKIYLANFQYCTYEPKSVPKEMFEKPLQVLLHHKKY